MSMELFTTPLVPWTKRKRAAVSEIAHDLAALDRIEIFSLRDSDDPEAMVSDLGLAIAGNRLIDGFVTMRGSGEGAVPVAVAAAIQDAMPHTANIVFFGREGHARVMPAVYRELELRARRFCRDHGTVLAQVPILSAHRAARRMAQSIGAEEAFEYGPVGRRGESYVHAIWRLDHGRILQTGATESDRTDTGDHQIGR